MQQEDKNDRFYFGIDAFSDACDSVSAEKVTVRSRTYHELRVGPVLLF